MDAKENENSENLIHISQNQSNSLDRFLRIDPLPISVKKISKNYVLIWIFQSMAFHITDSFLLLYLLEFYSWTEIAVVFSVQMFTQLIFDYPTGVLGDRIGQKKVLVIAYLFLISASLCILVSTRYEILFVFAILSGLGNSQFSGALDAWYDSHYSNSCTEIDPNREIYGRIQGRLYSIYLAFAGFSILLSGIIAKFISRRILFGFQIGFYVILLILISWKLTPVEKKLPKDTDQITPTAKEPKYFQILREGLKFLKAQKKVALFILGIAIYNAFIESVWTKLILIPLIEDYAQSDVLLGIVRWVNLSLDIFLVSILSIYSSKVKKKELGYIMASAAFLGCLLLLCGYLWLFPPISEFSLARFIGYWVLTFPMGIPYRLIWLFYSRIIIDLIPNNIRNSIYSLIPTVILLFSIPLNILGGKIIDTYGYTAGILLVVVFSFLGVFLQYRAIAAKKKGEEEG